jgi:YggT family protein
MFIYRVLDSLLSIYTLIVVARAVISWFAPSPDNPLWQFLLNITEPVLEQIRRFIPNFGGMDLSPLILIILIELVTRGLLRMLFIGVIF